MSLISYLRRHRKDDDRPYAIGGFTGVLLSLIFGVFALAVVDHFALQYSDLAAVISSVLVDLTNSERASAAEGTLTVSPVLTAAAQAKANDMAAKGYFAHVAPDGKNSWYWFEQAGYQFSYAGENLAVDFSDSSNVEQAWMNSPTHRANILNGNFTQIGIATAVGQYQGHTTTFVVQMFGTPADTTPVKLQTTLPTNPNEPALATSTKVATTTKPKLASTTPVVAKATTTPPAASTTVLGASTENTPTAPAPARASWWAYLLASPWVVLQYAYYALGAVLLVLLVLVTGLEFKQHHLRHVGAALALMLLMVGLFAFASLAIFTQPVLAAPSAVEAAQ